MSFKSLVEFLSPPKNENKDRFFPCHLSCCDTFVYWWMQQCTHTIALIFLGHSSADDKIPNIQIQKKMFSVQFNDTTCQCLQFLPQERKKYKLPTDSPLDEVLLLLMLLLEMPCHLLDLNKCDFSSMSAHCSVTAVATYSQNM